MNRWISLLIFIFICMNHYGQEKSFTLEDLIPGGKTYNQFVPRIKQRVQWYGDRYTLLDKDTMYVVDPKNTKEKKVLVTNEELRKLLKNEQLGISQVSFETIDNQLLAAVSIAKENKKVFFNLENKKVVFEIPEKKEWANVDFCAQNKRIALTIENNLYITDKQGQLLAITKEENKSIVCGQAVHRNEFGIKKGTFWSPGGNYLVFYRMDESMVEEYPLVDISAREAKLKSIKYPMAGMKSHEVTVGVYSLETNRTIFLQTGEPRERYFTNISWSPDEKDLYIAEINRRQDTCTVNRYNIQTGKKEATLFQETSDKYVEPEHQLLFLKKNPDLFIWQSKRSGYNHLFLYKTDGTLQRQVTSGNWDVTDILGIDEKEKSVFILSNELNPIEFQAYKVDLQNSKKTQLTFIPGVHSPSLNQSGSYLIDRYSSLTIPQNIDLIATSNPKPLRLQTAENPYVGYSMPEISLGSIKAADGKTDLYYRLVKPVNFDASKKYPTVIYVYGGPHSQMVKNSWLGSARGWDIYMAQKGYVVFSMDNRGTSNRGTEFENIIHRNVGINESADQMKGAEFLQSLSYVDKERMGVHGWSYGGFMTANLMLRYPETFKVGVAGGPVIDWKYYEIMYGERYMDSPQENEEGYSQSNMNNLAGNLKGHFLVIHGDEDPTVVWQQSLSFLKACIKARTYPDYFVYPGHGHNMVGPDRVHLHEKITRYFDDYLK